MDDLSFANCFAFNLFHWQNSHYTDNSRGITRHHIGYMREGTGLLISNEDRISVTAGDLFFIPKGCCYRSYWEGEHIHFDSFGFDAIPQLTNTTYCLQKIEMTDDIYAIYKELAADHTVSTRSVALLYALLAAILPQMALAPVSRQSDLSSRIVNYMRMNPSASIGAIAEACDVSESTLYQAFRKSLQKTPNTIRREIKCERAIQLLTSTSVPIEEISELAGFSSSSYFRKVLYLVTGKTPRQIRKEANTL